MKKALFIIACCLGFLLFSPFAAKAQLQVNALQKGTQIYGTNGRIAWNKFTVNDTALKVNEFGFDIFTGIFLTDRFALGFNMGWDDKVTKIEGRDAVKEQLLAIGAFTRYYFPFGNQVWAAFPELTGGFGRVDLGELAANGFAYTAGAGITRFIAPNIAVEAVLRYEGGSFSGDDDLKIKRDNFSINWGLQIYLY